MTHLLTPDLDLLEQNPEVKSHIYQQIMEFEPFVTPDTVISVIAKDPAKLALQYESENKEFDPVELSKMYRISISLAEDGGKLEAEGLHLDVFEAIKIAKENVLKKLALIQDSVISQQDRLIEINHVLSNRHLH